MAVLRFAPFPASLSGPVCLWENRKLRSVAVLESAGLKIKNKFLIYKYLGAILHELLTVYKNGVFFLGKGLSKIEIVGGKIYLQIEYLQIRILHKNEQSHLVLYARRTCRS